MTKITKLGKEVIKKNKKKHDVDEKNSKGKMSGKKHDSNRPQHRETGGFAPGNTIGNRFKPGQSGNPSGRPKKSVLDQALEDYLSTTIKVKGKDGKHKRKMVARVVAKALVKQLFAGKRGIAQLVSERVGGKPLQQIDAKVEEKFSDPDARKARIKELLEKATINSLDD